MKNSILIPAMLLMSSLFVMQASAQNGQPPQPAKAPHENVKQTTPQVETPIKNSLICMVNNRYMGIKQIPVGVNGKTYYGCCQGCVTKLKSQRHFRYALDPFTGEEVDKANAYAVLNPNGSGTVMYFKTANHYEKYFKNKNQ